MTEEERAKRLLAKYAALAEMLRDGMLLASAAAACGVSVATASRVRKAGGAA